MTQNPKRNRVLGGCYRQTQIAVKFLRSANGGSRADSSEKGFDVGFRTVLNPRKRADR